MRINDFVTNDDDNWFDKLKVKDDSNNISKSKSSNLCNLKIGDKVNVCCYTSMGDDGVEKIKDIKIQYDEKTGEKYNVIILSGKRKFDSRDGSALTPPTMYYIESRN